MVDYLFNQENGNSEHGKSSYEQLQEKIKDGELEAPRVRVKVGTTYISYKEFVQKQKNQSTGLA